MRVTYLYFRVTGTFTGFVIYQTSFGKKAMPWLRWLVTGHLLNRSGFDPRPIYRYLWWIKWQCDKLSSSTAVLFTQCSILIFHSPTSDTI